MNIQPVRTRVFKENEDLEAFIVEHIPHVADGTVLAVTSKIVALAEGRTGRVEDKDMLIEKESQFSMKTKYTTLTIKDGMVMGAAGIDESNADGKLVLLPKDSFASAEALREKLQWHFNVKNLGILITDSRLLPLRAGVLGIALGYAGIRGIRDYRGTPDIFGRELKLSRTDIADGLATAAVLEMGEGKEQQPLCVITDAPVEWADIVDRTELHINIEDDVYKPLFDKLKP